MFSSIRARIAVSAGIAMAFTLLIAMWITTSAFTSVNEEITEKVVIQLTKATDSRLISTALNESHSIANKLHPVVSNLAQIRSLIELSARTSAGADLIVQQFISALDTQDEAVFAGYMVWEEKTWPKETEESIA